MNTYLTFPSQKCDFLTRKPCLGVRLARFVEAGAPDPEQGDTVFIPRKGGTYMVKEPRPDGHGEARTADAHPATIPHSVDTTDASMCLYPSVIEAVTTGVRQARRHLRV